MNPVAPTAALVWFDGACSGNPGPMGAGAVVVLGNGREQRLSASVGVGTNNEAEYHGLILGLQAALDGGAKAVHVRGDSQLILRQLEGRYQVKAANLRGLYGQAKALLERFERFELEWVRREDNAPADAAARAGVKR